MKCEKCKYEWSNLVKCPLSCPRCKRRFDYPKRDKSNRYLKVLPL